MSSQHNTLFRYLTLLQLIPRSPGFKATPTLHMLLEERGFDVEMRAVQRDLEKLSGLFPLICDRKQKPYRWAFDAAYKSNLPALDTPTALLLVMAEEYLNGLLPQSAAQQLKQQFEAARIYLDQLKSKGYSAWNKRVKAISDSKALIPAPISSETWSTISEALLKGIALDVDYLSRAKSKETTFTLHSLGLVARHSVTYLLAMVDGFDDIRHFALHRIKKCQPSQSDYLSIENFDINDYLAGGSFGYRLEDQDIQLEAKIRPSIAWLLSETPLSEQQTLSEVDEEDWVMLKALVPYDQQLQWWILGFGADIEILAPVSLRSRMKELVKTMYELYQK